MHDKLEKMMPKSVVQRVHQVYSQLPGGERKVADAILQSPGDLAVRTASELASLTGVSNATVSRLFRRLGYANYDEARLASRHLRTQGSPLYLSGIRTMPEDQADSISDYLRHEMALIEASLVTLNPLILKEISDRLANARRVRFTGFRNSRFLADYANVTLRQFRKDVELMTTSGQTLAEGIAGIEQGDIAVIIGFRRRPVFFTNFVRAIAGTGADIVLIADNGIREAPAHAKWNITCPVETPQLVDSYLGPMSVIRTLLLATINRLGAEGTKYLTAVEELHENMSELE
ncbi:MAG TPA: MurR/RpiR family transcriptional regulator [Hyphomicrobiales bacterium]|nr:MurR/RpiR family transcriptional regulator [Hyphomicrobiales bacterium]